MTNEPFTTDDAALIALGRKLESAMAEEDALPVSEPDALRRANDRVWQVIDAIGALDPMTSAGQLVRAQAAARAFLELAYLPDDGMAPDERALAAMVRAFFPGRGAQPACR